MRLQGHEIVWAWLDFLSNLHSKLLIGICMFWHSEINDLISDIGVNIIMPTCTSHTASWSNTFIYYYDCSIFIFTTSRIPCLSSEDIKLETVLPVESQLRCHAGIHPIRFSNDNSCYNLPAPLCLYAVHLSPTSSPLSSEGLLLCV